MNMNLKSAPYISLISLITLSSCTKEEERPPVTTVDDLLVEIDWQREVGTVDGYLAFTPILRGDTLIYMASGVVQGKEDPIVFANKNTGAIIGLWSDYLNGPANSDYAYLHDGENLILRGYGSYNCVNLNTMTTRWQFDVGHSRYVKPYLYEDEYYLMGFESGAWNILYTIPRVGNPVLTEEYRSTDAYPNLNYIEHFALWKALNGNRIMVSLDEEDDTLRLRTINLETGLPIAEEIIGDIGNSNLPEIRTSGDIVIVGSKFELAAYQLPMLTKLWGMDAPLFSSTTNDLRWNLLTRSVDIAPNGQVHVKSHGNETYHEISIGTGIILKQAGGTGRIMSSSGMTYADDKIFFTNSYWPENTTPGGLFILDQATLNHSLDEDSRILVERAYGGVAVDPDNRHIYVATRNGFTRYTYSEDL